MFVDYSLYHWPGGGVGKFIQSSGRSGEGGVTLLQLREKDAGSGNFIILRWR